ncbi:MAG TPA: glycosyltransferase [Candidatus Dormibacteraeota bacterium]
MPRARIAVVSMHTSPTASLGESANGGMNVYIREISAAFSRCGIATDVFTRRVGADDPAVERIAPLGRVVYLPAGHDHSDKYQLQHHVEEFAAEALAFIDEQRLEYQLLYSHYWLSGLVARSLRQSLGLPWVHTAHTLGKVKNRQLAPGAKPEPVERIRAEREIAVEADRLIASTDDEREDLVELYGADRDRIAVVAPGIDLATFFPMPKEEAQRKIGFPDQRLLLFVGRLERLKGVETILRAMALAADRRHQDARLLVLGEDSRDAEQSEKDRLRGLAAELGIADRVEFLGSVAHHELPYFYAAAEACLMPSYSESFGLVGLEAQACGCAVIASNVSGLASVVREGVTGYLVDGHNPAEWADRILRLLNDPESAEQMGRRGVLLAQRFPWGLAADRVWAEMEPLVVRAAQDAARPN